MGSDTGQEIMAEAAVIAVVLSTYLYVVADVVDIRSMRPDLLTSRDIHEILKDYHATSDCNETYL